MQSDIRALAWVIKIRYSLKDPALPGCAFVCLVLALRFDDRQTGELKFECPGLHQKSQHSRMLTATKVDMETCRLSTPRNSAHSIGLLTFIAHCLIGNVLLT